MDNFLEQALLLENHIPFAHVTYLQAQTKNDADFALRSISTFDVLPSFCLNYRSCSGIKEPIFIEHQPCAQHCGSYRCGWWPSFPPGTQEVVGRVKIITFEKREN